MEGMIQIQLWTIFVLFVISALCSMSETALVGMSRIKIVSYIRNNHPAAKYLKVWMKDPNKLIATILIFNNIVNLSASTIGAFLSIRVAEIFGFNQAATTTVVAATITVIIIVFGEITPKIFAIHSTEKLGLVVIRPVVLVFYLIRPLTEIFSRISNFIVKLMGGKPVAGIPVISAKDITTVIDASAEEGYINETEKKMMAGILELGDMQVKEIMVPRTAIMGVELNTDIDRTIDYIIEDGYSRLPVFKKDLDHIIGIIYTKDMLSMIKNRGLIIFQDLIRVPYFVPETKKLFDLLKEFKKGKIHMAIVVDEFGGTSGLITLEDILEEIVGDIHDEYDVEEKDYEKPDDKTYVFKGRAQVSSVNQQFKLSLPEEDGVTTIGGMVTTLFGYVPKPGESIKMGNITFTVLKSDARKVERLKVEIGEESKENPEPADK
jgi:putative hemolysin